jgi:hypothetical protein
MSAWPAQLLLHPAPVAGGASEAVIEEARRRQRRRHLSVGAALLTLAVAVGGYVGAVRGSGGGTGATNVVAVQHATVGTVRSCAALPANALVVSTRPQLRGSRFLPKGGLHVQPLPSRRAGLWISPGRPAGSSTGTFCASS